MANEKRLIDAKDFDLRVSRKKMSEVFPNWKELPEEVRDAVCKHAQHLHMLLETQLTVDAVEVVHGRWEFSHTTTVEKYDIVKCSNCGHEAFAIAIYVKEGNYCPNCGAKMDGDGNG